MLAIGRDALGNLRREFTSGRENEGADLLIASALSFHEAVEEREGKASGLAGARLRSSHDITTRHHGRDRLSLNGGGRGVAFFLNGSEDLRIQAKFVECHMSEVVDLLEGRMIPPDSDLTAAPKCQDDGISKDEMLFSKFELKKKYGRDGLSG